METTLEQDRSIGCILGAFVGDSLGSYFEFKHGEQNEREVEKYMRMEGGGTYRLASGQITDDSELAICLMRGLIDGNGKLNTAIIAKYYSEWC